MSAQDALALLPDAKRPERMVKLLLSLREDALRTIIYEADMRGISVQELLRAVIIPEWVRENIRRPVQTIQPTAATRSHVFRRNNGSGS